MRQLKHLSLLLGLLLLGPSAYAQSVRFQSQAISSRGAGIANATVAVCTQPANTNTQPCSPLATLATSTSTTSGGANPLTADSFGNFFFYTAPGRYTVQIYGPAVSGQFVQSDVEVASILTGTWTNCQLNGVLYVPGATGCWAGSDIGAQLNTAYAACPAANTVCHIILTNSSPLSFSTTINFNTSGKYVLLESMYPCVFVTTAAGGCLNFTPTSGIALELDYVPATASGFTVAHGLKNVGLINNSCFTSGGCGGTAFAIDIGNTNHGASNATFDTVSIIGFNFGFNISNTQNLPSVFWKNPHFQDNNIAFLAGNETGNTIVGGLFIANQSNIQAETAVGGEYTLIGTGFSTNTSGPMFDFTRNTTRALFTCSGCHFEDSAAASANTPHYIQGSVDARIYGGTMETDQTSGTQDWFVNISAGGALEVHGLELSSGGKTFTQAFLLNTTARANIQATLFTPTLFPTVCGGAGCTGSSVLTISSNNNATAIGPTPTLAQTTQKAETGSADANVLTFTPTAVAGTYRACIVVSVASATAGVISWTLSWTDSNGNAQANIAQPLFQFGTAAPNTTFTTSATGNYEGCSNIDINNAGASIIVKWVGGGTTAAKVSATVERLI